MGLAEQRRDPSGVPPRLLDMRNSGLVDLSAALARAVALAEDLSAAPPAVTPTERPSFLVRQPDNDPQPIIEQLSRAKQLTFVLGAGASMEAGLPSWASLVREVLQATAPKQLGLSDLAAWLDAVAESGLLGMAAIARAQTKSDKQFVAKVQRCLYREQDPEQFNPGPLVREIAAWKRDCSEIGLATFNYDQLLERALRDEQLNGLACEHDEDEPSGTALVRHLHGTLTGNPAQDRIVLTEDDYALWSGTSWQDKFMERALQGVCVFLGLSFTDQNLLRWVYHARGDRHIAVFARQSAPRLSPAVRQGLETATRARLQRAHVRVYWADFYAEVAQLMHEARRRRTQPRRAMRPYPERAQQRALVAYRRCLPTTGLERRQREVRAILLASLAGVRAALEGPGVDLSKAVLGLGLWGLDYERRDVTLLASSDRLHVDSSTIKGVPLTLSSDWVAVEAITQGSVVERDPRNYASRWRAVRGIPLVWRGPREHERIVVGAATLTTTEPAGESIFDLAEQREAGTLQTIDIVLHDQLVGLWD
jgi:hypothetical protein